MPFQTTSAPFFHTYITHRMEMETLAERMVDLGADLSARDTLGRPALHLSLLHRMLPLARCIVARCCDGAKVSQCVCVFR